jgi:transcriptional regulator with XRE-family HTH domain
VIEVYYPPYNHKNELQREVKLMESLKKFREAKGITQAELATLVGLSHNTICNFENGHREPRLSDLIAFSKVFGCSVDDLVNPPHSLPVQLRRVRGKGRRRRLALKLGFGYQSKLA